MKTISGIDIIPGGTNAPSLYDIGYSLSQASRFGGHTKKPWTVLQHLYAAYILAGFLDFDEALQLHALLHDAHEAIIGDIPNPWKTEDMRKYQKELDIRIYSSLGIDLPNEKEEKAIKIIDTALLYAEADMIGPRKLGNVPSQAKKAVQLANKMLLPPHASGKGFEKMVTNILEKLTYATR